MAFLFFIVVPWKTTIVLPAILHAAEQYDVYAPDAAKIATLNVTDGQNVEGGTILAELESPDLETKLKRATQELNKLEVLRRRASSNPVLLEDPSISEASIERARVKMESYQSQKNRLIIKAPFAGVIRDLSGEIQEGRFISTQERLFTLVNPKKAMISAYATEDEQEKIVRGDSAQFRLSTSSAVNTPRRSPQ